LLGDFLIELMELIDHNIKLNDVSTLTALCAQTRTQKAVRAPQLFGFLPNLRFCKK